VMMVWVWVWAYGHGLEVALGEVDLS